MSISAATLDRLRALVGPHGYFDQSTDVEPFLVDHRKLYHGATPLVLRPDSTAQVAAIMKLCNDERIGVVPVGGNTS
jgi:FAD/FMN-containing dehydrogenase